MYLVRDTINSIPGIYILGYPGTKFGYIGHSLSVILVMLEKIPGYTHAEFLPSAKPGPVTTALVMSH